MSDFTATAQRAATLPGAVPVTVHTVGDVVTVNCAGCGGKIRLTWTTSAIGHRIYHSSCWEAQP